VCQPYAWNLYYILGEGAVGVAIDGNVVIVVDCNKVAELQMPCQRGSLAGHALLHASIAQEDICVVVDQLKSGLVVDSGTMLRGNGKTHGVGKALSKRSTGNFDTVGIVSLGVAGGFAVYGLQVNLLDCIMAVWAGSLTRKALRSSRDSW
jgi:hypothetical protein